MDQVALKALEVDPMQLMVIGMGLLALAIVTLAWFNSRSTNNLVGVMQSQVNSNSKMTENQGRQTDILHDFRDELRQERELREKQVGATKQLSETITRHDDKTDIHYSTIIDRIESASQAQVKLIEQAQTDLVGKTRGMLDESTAKVIAELRESVKPLQGDLGVIRVGLQAVQERRDREDAQYKADLDAIWDKAAKASQRLNDIIEGAIQKALGGQGEQIAVDVVGSVSAGGDVSAGAASGSAGDNGTGLSGDNSGTADGSIA